MDYLRSFLPWQGTSPKEQPPKQRIAVIGGGAAGLAALKIIHDSAQFKAGLWEPVLYESREDVGGVWLGSPPVGNPPPTPAYDSLTTNVPHPLFAYPTFAYPPSTPLFPPAATVQKYLRQYAEHFDLIPHIQLSTGVIDVRRTENNQRWQVTLSTGVTELFDFIAVANGHYHQPRYPDTPGLQAWLDDGRAIHSIYYRHPLPEYTGKTILVIGGGSSGRDISEELRKVAKAVVHSVTGSDPTLAATSERAEVRVYGRATEYGPDGSVVFEDGEVEPHIDYIVICTGFQFHFPFLSSVLKLSIPPRAPPLPNDLYNSSYHVFPLSQHIWPLANSTGIPRHSLAFVGHLTRVSPFAIAEAQSRAIVRAFAEPEALDKAFGAEDVLERVEFLRDIVGEDARSIAKAWHRFAGSEQYRYRDALNTWATGDKPGKDEAEGGKVADWRKELSIKGLLLRSEWRRLEAEGVAEDWVKGVGKGGQQEWIDLMRKIIKRAEERGEVIYGKGFV